MWRMEDVSVLWNFGDDGVERVKEALYMADVFNVGGLLEGNACASRRLHW